MFTEHHACCWPDSYGDQMSLHNQQAEVHFYISTRHHGQAGSGVAVEQYNIGTVTLISCHRRFVVDTIGCSCLHICLQKTKCTEDAEFTVMLVALQVKLGQRMCARWLLCMTLMESWGSFTLTYFPGL